MLHSNISQVGIAVPEPIAALNELLAKSYGSASGPTTLISIDRPTKENGPWSVDFSTKAGRVIIRWRNGTFCLINFFDSICGVEEGNIRFTSSTPEETIKNIQVMIAESLSASTALSDFV